MIFRNRRNHEIGRLARGSRRRRLANIISRKPRLESLEARHLLTAYLIDVSTDNAADASGVPDGALSLREAIIAANTNAAFGDAPAGMDDGDSIAFDGALAGATIILGNGEFSISDDLTIDGSAGGSSRITLDAGDLSRVFQINTIAAAGTARDVQLSNLITTNGNAQSGFGGGINVTTTTLSLSNVDITSSSRKRRRRFERRCEHCLDQRWFDQRQCCDTRWIRGGRRRRDQRVPGIDHHDRFGNDD